MGEKRQKIFPLMIHSEGDALSSHNGSVCSFLPTLRVGNPGFRRLPPTRTHSRLPGGQAEGVQEQQTWEKNKQARLPFPYATLTSPSLTYWAKEAGSP